MLNFFKNKIYILKSSSAFWYSILKYLEIGITAFTTFLVAEKVGPVEMGKAVPLLLYITYANYLALGVNQVVIKNYSLIVKEGNVVNFITINLQYILLVCLLNFIIAYLVIDETYFMVAALVSCAILLRGFFTSYFRVVYRIRILNKNNIIFSLILLIMVVFFVESWYDYMFWWAISIWICVGLYLVDGFNFFKKIFANIFKCPNISEIKYNLGEGAKLALMGAFTTVLLTADRFVLTHTDVSLAIKGSYQLADYAGMATYMVITTVIFYFYPKWIERLRNEEHFRYYFLKIIKRSFFLIIPIVLMAYIGTVLLTLFAFKEYIALEYFIVLNILLKLLVVLISACGTIYIGLNMEVKFLKTSLPFLLCLIIAIITLIFYIQVKVLYIPLILCLINLSLLIFEIKQLKKILINSNFT